MIGEIQVYDGDGTGAPKVDSIQAKGYTILKKNLTIFATNKVTEGVTTCQTGDPVDFIQIAPDSFQILFDKRLMPSVYQFLKKEHEANDGRTLKVQSNTGETYHECVVEEVVESDYRHMKVSGFRISYKNLTASLEVG